MRERGFSIVETLISLTIVGTAVFYFSKSLVSSRVSASKSHETVAAEAFATELLEYFLSKTARGLQAYLSVNPINAGLAAYPLCAHINLLDRQGGKILNEDPLAELPTDGPLFRNEIQNTGNRFYVVNVIDLATLQFNNNHCGSTAGVVSLGTDERFFVTVGVSWRSSAASEPERISLSSVLPSTIAPDPLPQMVLRLRQDNAPNRMSYDSLTLGYNTSATVTWSSTNATSCTLMPPGITGTSGTHNTGNLITRTNYILNCTGPAGSSQSIAEIYVDSPTPTVQLLANGTDNIVTVAPGSTVNLSWSSTDATSCSVNPGGSTGVSGSSTRGPLTAGSTQTYTATCTGPGGNITDSVTVNVSNPRCVRARMDDPYGDLSYGELQIQFMGENIERSGNSARATQNTSVAYQILFGAQCRYDVYLNFAGVEVIHPYTTTAGFSWSAPFYRPLAAGQTISVIRARTRDGGSPCNEFYNVFFTTQRWEDC